MANNAGKEKWISEVLNSTNSMRRAEPGADLYEKVSSELAKPQIVKAAPLPMKQWVAAAVLLLAINIGSALYFTSQHTKAAESANPNPIAAALQEVSTYNY